jgi:uncharacterized DUF497 family protein
MFPLSSFEWDDAKAASNLAKHGVPFAFAARVVLDVGVVDFDATRAPDREARRKAVGLIDGRIYTVVYAQRGGATRLISARRAT